MEPDRFQLANGDTSTTGYDALVTFVEQLRPTLERTTGKPVSFGWFFRMDPQIATAFGRADHLVSGFDARVADLIGAGDHVGLHTHLLRWSDEHAAWVHDLTDPKWTQEAISASFAAFEQCFGTKCERHRTGAALYNQDIVDALLRAGVLVETAIEPVRGGGIDGVPAGSGLDRSPIVGRNSDCARAPRRPYRPSPTDFLQPGTHRNGMVLLPMTTSWLSATRPAWQTVVGNALRWHRRPPARMLYLADGALSPMQYWDLVARQLRFMRRPYINVAVRTGAAGSPYFERVCAALTALTEHPLSTRVALVDPLAALPDLLEAPAASVRHQVPA